MMLLSTEEATTILTGWGSVMMRKLLASALTALAVQAATPGAAQSPYDYPWCRGASPTRSCYYKSYEECMAFNANQHVSEN